jgi:hypothetical protein
LDYVANGGDPNAVPSYTARYRFTAQTQFFQDSFTIEGSVSFTIGNFNTCE